MGLVLIQLCHSVATKPLVSQSNTFPDRCSVWQRANGKCLCKCFANDALYLQGTTMFVEQVSDRLAG